MDNLVSALFTVAALALVLLRPEIFAVLDQVKHGC